MERYDIAIIGTGPAGMSAAITAKVRNKKILLLGGKDLSTKVSKAHAVNNYLGLPAVTGEAMAKAFGDHLKQMEIEITDTKVGTIYSMGDYFSLQVGEEMVEASSVILATGVVQGKPLPGEEAYVGKGVSYCATCDGQFYRGKKTVVIGYSAKEEAEADYLAELAEKVVYIPMYKEEVHTDSRVKVVREKPEEILGEKKVTGVKTDQGIIEADGVFVMRDAVAPSQLVPGLATEGPHVVVDLQMKTNIPGLFACGDIAGTPYQYIKAAGQGNVAALSAAAYLDEKKRQAAQ